MGKDVHHGLFDWFLVVSSELYIAFFEELLCGRDLKSLAYNMHMVKILHVQCINKYNGCG